MEKSQKIAVVSFIYRERKILIAKRALTEKFFPGVYELPGGHVEYGESPEEALVREIQEELHVDLTIKNPFYAFTYINESKKEHTIENVYLAEMKDPDQEIILNPENHCEFAWIAEDEINEYFTKDNERELRAAKEGFKMMKHEPKPGIDYIGITTPFCCVDENGRFLLHKRSKNCRDEHGKWDIGGGKLEFGLTPEENVLKEVSEEYGCKGKILEQFPIYTSLREWDGKKLHWLAIGFVIRVKSTEAKNGEPRAMDEIGFYRLDEFPSPLHPAFENALKVHRKIFEKYSKPQK